MTYFLNPSEIPTLSYTWSPKKVPLSGGASPYRPLASTPRRDPPISSGLQQSLWSVLLYPLNTSWGISMQCHSNIRLASLPINNTVICSRILEILGPLSKDDDNDSENFTQKQHSRCFKFHRFIPTIVVCHRLEIFSGVEFWKTISNFNVKLRIFTS